MSLICKPNVLVATPTPLNVSVCDGEEVGVERESSFNQLQLKYFLQIFWKQIYAHLARALPETLEEAPAR